jgi:hypothetical protein
MSSQFGEAIAKTMIVPKMIASGQPIPPQWSSFAPGTPVSPTGNLGPMPTGVAPPSAGRLGAAGQQRTIMGQAAIEQPFTQTKLGRANTGGT